MTGGSTAARTGNWKSKKARWAKEMIDEQFAVTVDELWEESRERVTNAL